MTKESKKNEKRNCPGWFRYRACVIIYDYRKKILLVKRPKNKKEGGGKWAIPGGDGAFGKSKNPPDFARREIEFDLGVKNKKLINTKELKEFKTIIDKNKLSWKITMFFYCNGDKYKDEIEESKKNNLIKVADCDWFTIKEIKEKEEKEEIAFDNAKVLCRFWEEILSNLC